MASATMPAATRASTPVTTSGAAAGMRGHGAARQRVRDSGDIYAGRRSEQHASDPRGADDGQPTCAALGGRSEVRDDGGRDRRHGGGEHPAQESFGVEECALLQRREEQHRDRRPARRDGCAGRAADPTRARTGKARGRRARSARPPSRAAAARGRRRGVPPYFVSAHRNPTSSNASQRRRATADGMATYSTATFPGGGARIHHSWMLPPEPRTPRMLAGASRTGAGPLGRGGCRTCSCIASM